MTDIPAIEARDLSMRFGRTQALDHFNCKMEGGHIYGLLGRNGAGKSTFLRLLTAQAFTRTGEVRVRGRRPGLGTLGEMCFISDTPDFGGLTRVRDVLNAERRLHPNWSDAVCSRMVERFELDVRRKTKGLSRGMQTAVGLVCGLASQAQITIFDEPSLGLDAVSRERFYDALIDAYAERPRTIVLSTHLIDEVARVLETAVMIDHGKLILQRDVDELRQLCVTVSGAPEAVTAATRGLRVLHEESFAGAMARSVFMDAPRQFPQDVKTEPIGLQRLFVLLTDAQRGGEADGFGNAAIAL